MRDVHRDLPPLTDADPGTRALEDAIDRGANVVAAPAALEILVLLPQPATQRSAGFYVSNSRVFPRMTQNSSGSTLARSRRPVIS
jgi:hypothetical protein